MTDCTVLRNFVIYWNMVFKKSTDRKRWQKRPRIQPLLVFVAIGAIKKLGFLEKKVILVFIASMATKTRVRLSEQLSPIESPGSFSDVQLFISSRANRYYHRYHRIVVERSMCNTHPLTLSMVFVYNSSPVCLSPTHTNFHSGICV